MPGGALVTGVKLFRSDDLGTSWTEATPPPRPVEVQYPFAWANDLVVFGVAWNDSGVEILRPVELYDWSDDTWIDGPQLELGAVDDIAASLSAWSPLSDTKLAVVMSRPGNNPDGTPPAASFVHELDLGTVTWDMGYEEGPWFGPQRLLQRALPYSRGWLWVDGARYEDATDSWCYASDSGEGRYRAQGWSSPTVGSSSSGAGSTRNSSRGPRSRCGAAHSLNKSA